MRDVSFLFVSRFCHTDSSQTPDGHVLTYFKSGKGQDLGNIVDFEPFFNAVVLPGIAVIIESLIIIFLMAWLLSVSAFALLQSRAHVDFPQFNQIRMTLEMTLDTLQLVQKQEGSWLNHQQVRVC